MTTVIEPALAPALRPAGVRLRAGVPGDADAVQRMFRRCGADTRYGRFWTVLDAIPAAYLNQTLGADPAVHDAIVAETGSGEIVALGSAVRVPTGHGPAVDVGLLVEDRWQRHGLGTRLFVLLAARARGRGIGLLRADVLSGRAGLLAPLRRHLGAIAVRQEGIAIAAEARLR